MRLSRLSIRHFRNLGTQELELPREGVALIGDNAQGKSNFLEAIYYLETFRSFRGARDEQLVSFDQGFFRIAGTVEDRDGEVGEIAAAFERKGKRKKVSVGGKEPVRIGDALGHLAAVIFSPADVDLVSGGPAERRRFLDIALSLSEPGYLGTLQEYRQILARRNAALKAGQTGSVVSAWDQGLVRAGSEIVRVRRDWIAAQDGAFGDYYARISAEGQARMVYRPGFPLGGSEGIEEIRAAFRDALSGACGRERRMRVTVVGPHRDEVFLRLDDDREGLDLREYGSGGQRRTAALALRLVEARTIRERRDRRPLILLDDVFAELDGGRSERVLDVMEAEETGQVFLTAPKPEDVRVRANVLARWRISAGRIET